MDVRGANGVVKRADFDKLNPIHIAGTKGKGSTSAFISSILSQYMSTSAQAGSIRLRKIGLYTSPHLRSVRERIQINNVPLSEEDFARYFFVIWDRLEASARKAGLPVDVSAKPVYFRFLTLMALHAFLEEGVDTAVIETGIGGEYDSTNILVHPSVTGITSLGIDHTVLLGNTIEEIAWHKAGIMKPGALAFTVPQPDGAMRVLEQRAEERSVRLNVVERHPELEHIRLGLAADYQKTNASLAIAVAAAHLRRLGFEDIPVDITSGPLPDEFRRGLEQVRWSGRCETRREGKVTWLIDGGHTLESIRIAGEWYAHELRLMEARVGSLRRVLIFNQQTRDAVSLANVLHQTLQAVSQRNNGHHHHHHQSHPHPFTDVIFCTNVTYKKGGYKADLVSLNANSQDVEELTVQKELARAWAEIETNNNGSSSEYKERTKTNIQVLQTIEEAVDYVRNLVPCPPPRLDDGRDGEMTDDDGKREKDEKEDGREEEEVAVLVTGSLHLVGGLLEGLESKKVA